MRAAAEVAPESEAKVAARRALIAETADAVGRSWAERRRSELRKEGRRAAGGWPGTLREARGVIDRALEVELRGHKMDAVTADEREGAARATNASARTTWLRAAEPDEG
jgi:hypothetical protein